MNQPRSPSYLFSSVNLCFIVHEEVFVLYILLLLPVLVVVPEQYPGNLSNRGNLPDRVLSV